jgi:glucose/arabinose dehydrogenase
MTRRMAVVGAALLLGFSGAFAQQEGPGAVLRVAGAGPTAPAVAQGGGRASQVEALLGRVTLPPGFRIALFALVPDARHMAVSADGNVIVVGTYKDRLYAVTARPDRTAASEVRRLAATTDLVNPNGPCFGPDGTLYVVERNRILAYPAMAARYREAQVEARVVVPAGALVPRAEERNNHAARVCRVGPDGRLYVALGQPYNVPPAEKSELYARLGIGGIIRMDTDGGNREVFATGIRNSVGLDFNPADRTLWFTDNQVDGMGDGIPPGELNRATRAGQDFGFPWYGGGRVRTRDYAAATPPAGVVFPQVEMDAHAADLGMAFYTGTRFPARFRGAIFSAQHGSWNRTEPIGARVMVTPVKPDGTADRAEVFAAGWLTRDGSYLGRPVDVAMLPDGSLLVSDDYAGAIYRITYERP